MNKKEEYDKDPRPACKYGSLCYQKNPEHHKTYKHLYKKKPADENANNKANPPKKFKKDNKEDEKKPSGSKEDVKQTVETNPTSNEKESYRNFILENFIIDVPDDFYAFWDFCKTLNSHNPLEALKEIDLTLVGPYDVLAGRFNDKVFDKEQYSLHWRFFYDPPELVTVLAGNQNGYHIGYYRDAPLDKPGFLAENYAAKDGTFIEIGENIFAAVNSYLENYLKTCNPFKKVTIKRFIDLIKKTDWDLSKVSANMKKRQNKTLAKSLNGLGLVIPYNKKLDIGYRNLPHSNKQLKQLLEKLKKAQGNDQLSDNILKELEPSISQARIATDECDFGTGLKLGLDILSFGVANNLAKTLLCTAYQFLDRKEFQIAAKAHMDNRKKFVDDKLSILG